MAALSISYNIRQAAQPSRLNPARWQQKGHKVAGVELDAMKEAVMRSITTTLILGTMLCGLTLFAQNAAPKTPAPEDKSTLKFSVRKKTAEPLKGLSAIRNDEPIVRDEIVSPAIPVQSGSGPHAPTICRHEDFTQDMEFRLCMSQLLGSSESMSRSDQNDARKSAE